MDFIKDVFLKLTKYSIPYGYEHTLEEYLPEGIKQDYIGNYYINIGKSETLFTTHLDTYCEEYVKINQIVDGDIVKTDGKTTLGGDNKLGCTILLYMISKNIPGLYYFFLSEEPISEKGGRFGSLSALKENEQLFLKYKRCVAFDRKQTGSIVTRQLGRRCCSEEFSEALSKEFLKNGLVYKSDHKAYYTDTSTFIDTISECTNLSAGGWNEHYKTEWVDLSYTRKVAEAACNIDWEKLPTYRELDNLSKRIKNFSGFNTISLKVINEITTLMSKYDHLWTNKKRYDKGYDNFLHFNAWFDDTDIKIFFEQNKYKFMVNDINKSFNTLRDLDLFLNDIFGVPFDVDQLGIDEEDNVNIYYNDDKDILTMPLMSYIKYFNKINSINTSFKVKGCDEQFLDYDEVKLTKKQFFKFIKQNELI